MRSVAGSANAVLETRAYDPYGQPLSSTGTPQTPFGFTGELADGNGLLYLRARHYAPRLGAFPSLDPYEGSAARPMSLNGYSWVEGRVADGRDPSGFCMDTSICGFLAAHGVSVSTLSDMGCGFSVNEIGTNATPTGNCAASSGAFAQRGDWSGTMSLGGGIGLYTELVANNRARYVEAARGVQLNLFSLMNLEEIGLTKERLPIPASLRQDLLNMSLQELAARIAAVPMALNVAGWLQDWFNNTSGTQLVSEIQSRFGSVLASVAPGLLESQSAGYLELRFAEFQDLVTDNTSFDNGIASPYSTRSTLTHFGHTILQSCNSDVGSCYGQYIRILDTNSTNGELLARVSAARYLNHLIQFITYSSSSGSDFTRDWQQDPTLWTLRCSAGVGSGSNICSTKITDQPNDGARGNFHAALSYMRYVFGSGETSCLVPLVNSNS